MYNARSFLFPAQICKGFTPQVQSYKFGFQCIAIAKCISTYKQEENGGASRRHSLLDFVLTRVATAINAILMLHFSKSNLKV